MTQNISGNTPKVLKTGVNTASKLAKAYKSNGMEGIGNIWEQQAIASGDAAINGMVDNFVQDPAANAAVKGAIDIVKTVLLNMYNAAELKAEDDALVKDLENAVSQSNTLADKGNADATAISNETKSQIDETQQNIDTSTSTITNTVTDASKEIAELQGANSDEANAILENNAKIAELSQKQAEILDKINQAKEQYQIEIKEKQSKSADENPNGRKFLDGDVPGMPEELKALIADYNALGVEMAGLDLENQVHAENAKANSANIEELNDTSIQVSEEMAASIDEQTQLILDVYNTAEGAITEMTNVLQGNFKQIDKVTCVKLATMALKSAICGTNTGLLSAAAAAAGVGSLFDGGQKVIQLTNAATNEGGRATTLALKNAAGKMLEQTAKAYANQIMSNIIGGLSPELQEVYGGLMEVVQMGFEDMQANGVDISNGELNSISFNDIKSDDLIASLEEGEQINDENVQAGSEAVQKNPQKIDPNTGNAAA